MNKNKLCAAVLSGMLLGAGSAMAPVAMNLPVTAVAQASAHDTITAVVDNSRILPTSNEQGQRVYPSIKAALKDLQKQHAGKTILKLSQGTYREKIEIAIPNLTLVGDDAKHTVIVWNDAEGTPLRPSDKNGNKKEYTMECASVKVTEAAKDFQAVNVTFQNDFLTEARRADKTMKSVQAFALTDEADQSSFYNCRFLGRQDTLYANAGKQYYKDCYIEGDVDFIFGQASAAVFEDCEIRSIDRAGKGGKGYVTAPSTLAQDKGYLFYKCHLTSDIKAPDYGMLGRPWHPSSEKRAVNSAATFRECQIDTVMKAKAWSSMKNKYGEFQPQDNRLFEYKNTGKGALTGGNRTQLTDAQAAGYTPAAFLGKWLPKKRV